MHEHKPLQYLIKPVYVIQMGWHRWGTATRLRWLRNLRKACEDTIEEIDYEIKRISQ